MIIASTCLLSLFQLKQYGLGVLRYDDMSFRAYLKIFGKTSFPKDFPLLFDYTDAENAKKGLAEREILHEEYFHLPTIDSNYVGIKAFNGKYICADKEKDAVIANRNYIGEWETFLLIQRPKNLYSMKSFQNKFLGINPKSKEIVARKERPGQSELFRKIDLDDKRFVLKTYNGDYVTVASDSSISLMTGAKNITSQSVFELVNR
jgi:hypothetical protein